MANTEYSRFLLKRSLNSGVVPTVPLINDINTFTATDIFEGELFYNVADGVLFSRDLVGITVVAAPAAPNNLLNTLLLGNNTGASDIVIDNPQVIRNPLASTPLDSYITTGTVGDPNRIVLESQDLSIGNSAALTVRSNGQTSVATQTADLVTGTVGNLFVNADPTFGLFYAKTGGGTTNNISCTHNLIGAGAAQTMTFTNTTVSSIALSSIGLADIHSDFSSPAGTTKWTQNDTVISSSVSGGAYFTALTSAGGGALNIFVPRVHMPLLAFADDAAAGAAGLVTADLYQTTGAGAAPLNAAGILMIKQ